MIIIRARDDFQDVVTMNRSRDEDTTFEILFAGAPCFSWWEARRCLSEGQSARYTRIRVITSIGILLDGVHTQIVSHLLLIRIVQWIVNWATDCVLLIFDPSRCGIIVRFSEVFEFLFELHFFEFYLFENDGIFETHAAQSSGVFLGTRIWSHF